MPRLSNHTLRVLAVGLALGICAWADPMEIVFDSPLLSAGSISYSGGAAPLIGQNLPIGIVEGFNVPKNSNQALQVTGPGGFGTLSFTTGALTSETLSPLGNSYTFSGNGGSIQITGGVPAASLAPSWLLTGGLLEATVTMLPGRGPSIELIMTNGTDIKNPSLLSFFGVNPQTAFAFTGSILAGSWAGANPTTGAFSATGWSSTITNTATAVAPEPTSILLLGTAALMIGFFFLKRTSANS